MGYVRGGSEVIWGVFGAVGLIRGARGGEDMLWYGICFGFLGLLGKGSGWR